MYILPITAHKSIALSKSQDFDKAIISFSLEGSGNLSFPLKRKVSGKTPLKKYGEFFKKQDEDRQGQFAAEGRNDCPKDFIRQAHLD
ncbi:MAG: hypothetical protein A2007_05435 [Verrucomicrobia bacterium GWC2_42_7]|nr:MAG: hypothetical protein A2007_05435 [Verrucomicrobia bacterium GWC2_42_7]